MNRWLKTAHLVLCWLILSFIPALADTAAIKLAPGVRKLHTVEGISEYRLSNGLRFIVFPDAAKATVTVNITYLVGSRHESYGETGMAHLLEHLIFKGSKNFLDPAREFKARGFQINGTTWLDRTNYYLTFPASADNVRWALAWTADAMVNSFIARKDLDTEMSVVRNEFEMGENDPASVMLKRMQSLLFDWHNYGNNTIGARSDIENVKIENLKAFYRTYYQPDNAVLTIAGRFDEQQTIDRIVAIFGRLPKPSRILPEHWTVEPTADGERQFTVRRKGEVPLVTLAYRTPSSLHPDSDGVGMAAEILGDTPNGRLHKELVDSGLAAQVFAYTVDAREPGFVVFGATVNKGKPIAPVRDKLIEVVEGTFTRQGATVAELGRAVEQSRTAHERALADPEAFAVMLSEYIALGDWRLFFYARDQLDQITPADVDSAARKYFVRDNRVLGTFLPEDSPQRAVVPESPSAAQLLSGFKTRENGDAGEAFEPSHDNITTRSRLQTFDTLKIALLPKKNRGQTVNVAMSFRWGDETSLANRSVAGQLAIAMLTRGTSKMTRQQIADEIVRLKVRGSLTHFETTRDKLPAALRLVAHLLQDANFPKTEFEALKREHLTALQSQLDSPEDLSSDAMRTHFNTYPPGDPRHHIPLAQRIELVQGTTHDEVIGYYRDLVGTARGEIAVVGDFDEKAIAAELASLFPGHLSKSPYSRVDRQFREIAAKRIVIETADKENAIIRARSDLRLRDDDPDAPALYVANNIIGGGSGLSSRLMDRLRQKDGISYSVTSTLSMGSRQALSSWSLMAMTAPQNAARAEQAILEEIRRAQRDGFTPQEVAEAKKGLLESRTVSRSQDPTLAAQWSSYLDLGRNWEFSKDFEAKIAALSAEQVNAAFRKYIDPERLTVVVAVDSRKSQAGSATAEPHPRHALSER